LAAQRVAQGVFENRPRVEKGTSEFRKPEKALIKMVEARKI